jgi:hypothetical protein
MNAIPPSPRGLAGSSCAGGSMASSAACTPAAKGLHGRSRLAPTAPCLVTSRAGAHGESSHRAGPFWCKQARSGAGSTGRGRRLMRRGARPVGGDLVGPPPTARGQKGVKRRLGVEADGGPLGMAIAGAHVHDTKRLAETPEAIGVERPEPTAEQLHPLCLEKGDAHPTGPQAAVAHHDTPHRRRLGEETFAASRQQRYPARRWVVERTWAWLSKGRALLGRDDKQARNFLGLLQVACALLGVHRRARLIGD